MLSFILTVLLLWKADGYAAAPVLKKIAPDLQEMLATGRNSHEAANFSAKTMPEDYRMATFIVWLGEKAELPADIKSPNEQTRAVCNALRSAADKSQKALIALLKSLESEGHVSGWQSFFLTNTVAVRGDLTAAYTIAALEEVARLTPNYPVAPAPISFSPDNALKESEDLRLSAYNWNVDVVDAERVWSEYGVRGEGVVIASISSGVQWDHPALKSSYRGWNGATASHAYNWFSMNGELYGADYGASQTNAPTDSGSLGTFTMGCAVGDGKSMHAQTGVAPGARWMAVTPSGLQTSGTYRDNIMMMKCFQWLIAPTDLSGQAAKANPAMAPHIVFCSFSTMNPLDETFRANIQALKAAGIIVVAPAGDVGDAPGGAASPGSLPEVFSVGAVDKWGKIYNLSGRGPSFYGAIKPDACAPGVDVFGCIPSGQYEGGYSGTAIAAAHAAGVFALLRSAEPKLHIDILDRVMRSSCKDLGEAGPDNTFGWGYINALRAMSILRAGSIIKGSATRSDNAKAIQGVRVQASLQTSPNDNITTFTRADGSFAFPLFPGVYDVAFSHIEYEPLNIYGVTVQNGLASLVNATLKPKPVYQFSGRIVDAVNPNVAIPGTITIKETGQSVTTMTGNFSFMVPTGTYNLKITGRSAHRSARQTITISGTTKMDFKLASAPSILLVDAEGSYSWNQGWQVLGYYQRALDDADYSFDSLIIGAPWEMPSVNTLIAYEVVIWAQSNFSPNSVGAADRLKGFLDAGGKLLLCGQNIGRYDSDTALYKSYFKASYVRDDAAPSGGSGSNALRGANIAFGGAGVFLPENAPKSFTPDVISPLDTAAVPCFYYDNGELGGLAVSNCGTPAWKVVYLSFGLDSVNPDNQRSLLLEKAISWLAIKPSNNAVSVSPGDVLVKGEIGRSIICYETIYNMGKTADNFNLSIAGGNWHTSIWREDLTTQITETGALAPCGSQKIAIKIDVPHTAKPLGFDNAILKVGSKGNLAVESSHLIKTASFVNWRNEAEMMTRRYRQVSASPKECEVYVIGGLDWQSAEVLDLNERYDVATGRWTACAPKTIPCANAGAAVLGGKIYVVGGFNREQVPRQLSAIEVYDPTADSWEYKANLPYFAYGVACASLQGRLYTFGGFNGVVHTDYAYCYDADTEQWTSLSPMPGGARSHAQAVAADGKIFVLGGFPNLSIVESYNPLLKSWTTVSPMRQGRHSFGCEAVVENGNPYIYVFGGGGKEGSNEWFGLSDAERYDIRADKWEIIYPLNDKRRAGCSSAFSGGRLFAFGGISDSPADYVESLSLRASLIESTIAVDKATAQPNDKLTYTIKIRNSGLTKIDGVHLNNPISEYATYLEDSATGGLEWTSNTKTLTWNGFLNSNEERIMTFQTVLNRVTFPGIQIENILNISGDSCGELTRAALTTIEGPSLVQSTKKVDKKQAIAGDTLTYSIYLVNKSTEYDATGLQLFDPIPAHATFVNGSATGGCFYNSAEKRIEWSGNLLKSSEPSFTPTYTDSISGQETFNWRDGGNKLSLEGDDMGLEYPLPFKFQFFGVDYSKISISTNGYLAFSPEHSVSENQCLPSTQPPNAVIAPFWDDLTISSMAGDGIWVGSEGTAPNRLFFVRWKAHHFSDFGNYEPAFEFEAILYEKDSEILFQYKTMDSAFYGDGSTASVGMEDPTGAKGITYHCQGLPVDTYIRDSLAVRIKHVHRAFLDERNFTFKVKVDEDWALCNEALTNTASLRHQTQSLNLAATTMVNSTPVDESATFFNKPFCQPDEVVTITVNAVNSGNIMNFFNVFGYIPEHTTFVSVLNDSGTWNPLAGRVEWSGLIMHGSFQPVVYQVRVDRVIPDGAVIVAQGEVSGNCAPEVVFPRGTSIVQNYNLADTSISAAPAVADPGEVFHYTIILVNKGMLPASPLMGTDIPETIKINQGSAFATSGNIAVDYQNNTLAWSGTIPAKSTVTLFFDATVNEGATPGMRIPLTVHVDFETGRITKTVTTRVKGISGADFSAYMLY